MIAVSCGAYWGIQNQFFYYFLFALNGLMQSSGFPTCVSIFTNWFGKRGRGTLFGLWCSTGAAGNVIGAMLTSTFTSTLGLKWYQAYAAMGLFCSLMAGLNAMYLVVHPIELDIHIDEFDEHLHETERLLNTN